MLLMQETISFCLKIASRMINTLEYNSSHTWIPKIYEKHLAKGSLERWAAEELDVHKKGNIGALKK